MTLKGSDCIYEEKVSSRRTEALFVLFTLLFLMLFVWRLMAGGMGFLAMALFLLFVFFLLYSLNYRTLIIHMTAESLELRFGIFRWTVPLEDIEECQLDDSSMWRIGGAGIHFTRIRKRYRGMFNFLEHPRVVIELRRRKGPVREIAFSTRRPDEIMGVLREVISRGQ
jgi:Ca2+/Na+ antiporter